MKLRSRFFEISFVGLTLAGISIVAACSTTDAGDDSAAGAGGTATSTAGSGTNTGGSSTSTAGTSPVAGSSSTTGGSTGTAGSTGSAGTGPAPMGTMCPPATTAMLTSFDPVDGGGTVGTFGDFSTMFSGGEFVYPSGTQSYPLTVDTSMGDYHVTGTVGTYSGIGLYWGPNPSTCQATDVSMCPQCNEVDLSAYDGITFTVKGSAPATVGANVITFTVGTAADDVSAAFLNAHKSDSTAADALPSFGRCTPSGSPANQYDGTCGSPTFKVTITDTVQTVNVKWSDLTGGKPSMSVDPSQITGISWVLPSPPGAGTASPTTYDLDLTIDDFGLIPHAAN